MYGKLLNSATLVLTLALAAGCVTSSDSRAVNDSLLQAALEAQNKTDYVSAAKHYRKLYIKNPDDLGILLELSRSLRYTGSAAEAVGLLEKNRETHAKESAFFLELGKSKLADGKAADAIDNFKIAGKREPMNWQIHSATGIAYDVMGDYDKALRSYKTANGLSPGNPVILNNMAISHAQAGNIEEAISILKKASVIGRNNPQLRQNLALFHGINGDIKEAEALARMDLDEGDVRNNLAFYYLFQNKRNRIINN